VTIPGPESRRNFDYRAWGTKTVGVKKTAILGDQGWLGLWGGMSGRWKTWKKTGGVGTDHQENTTKKNRKPKTRPTHRQPAGTHWRYQNFGKRGERGKKIHRFLATAGGKGRGEVEEIPRIKKEKLKGGKKKANRIDPVYRII